MEATGIYKNNPHLLMAMVWTAHLKRNRLEITGDGYLPKACFRHLFWDSQTDDKACSP